MATDDGSNTKTNDKKKRRSSSSSTASSSSSLSSSLYWFASNEDNEEKVNEDRGDPTVNAEDEIFFEEEDTDTQSNTPSWQGHGYYGNQEMHHVKSERAKIIREILAQFDMEEVMDRYRGESAYTGYNRRQNNLRFRLWLDKAMGNDKIPKNDRKWNDKIRQKVLDDFERRQDEKEQRLADAESQRLLKLKIQGLIKDDEHGTEDKQGDNSLRKKTSLEREWCRRTTQKHHSLYKPTEDLAVDGSRRSRGRKQNSPTYYSPDIESQMEIMNRSENEIKERREKQQQKQQERDQGDGREDSDNDTSSNYSHSQSRKEKENESRDEKNDSDYYEDQPTYRGHLGRSRVEKKIVHPDLEKLYKEEDLDKLYREADNLVRRTGGGTSKN